MKKIILTLFFLFAIFSLSNVINSSAERSSSTTVVINSNDELMEKLNKLEKKVYVDNLIQHIEFESEIIIPDYVDVKYVEYAYNLANQLKISTRMIFRLMYRESRFNDTIVSSQGARGFMQLMPDTRAEYAELLNVDTLKLDKDQEDIYIGMNYLKDLHDYWKNRGNSEKYSWKLCLASYNAGKGSVKKYQGIPPYKETMQFVDFISKAHSNPEFYSNYIKKYENSVKVSS